MKHGNLTVNCYYECALYNNGRFFDFLGHIRSDFDFDLSCKEMILISNFFETDDFLF